MDPRPRPSNSLLCAWERYWLLQAHSEALIMGRNSDGSSRLCRGRDVILSLLTYSEIPPEIMHTRE